MRPVGSDPRMTLANTLERDRLHERLQRMQRVLNALCHRELRRSEDGTAPEALRLAITGFQVEMDVNLAFARAGSPQ
jgi:hypothetical protein